VIKLTLFCAEIYRGGTCQVLAPFIDRVDKKINGLDFLIGNIYDNIDRRSVYEDLEDYYENIKKT
jgi:hypothetical protein